MFKLLRSYGSRNSKQENFPITKFGSSLTCTNAQWINEEILSYFQVIYGNTTAMYDGRNIIKLKTPKPTTSVECRRRN